MSASSGTRRDGGSIGPPGLRFADGASRLDPFTPVIDDILRADLDVPRKLNLADATAVEVSPERTTTVNERLLRTGVIAGRVPPADRRPSTGSWRAGNCTSSTRPITVS